LTGPPNASSTALTPQPSDSNGPAALATAPVPSNATTGAIRETPDAVEPQTIPAEIAIGAPETLPNASETLQAASEKSSFSLSVSTHLVDVDVSAVDGRGKPLTHLAMNDFEVYDNGKKQTVRSLSRVSGGLLHGAQDHAAAVQGTVYSNRSEGLSSPTGELEGAQALPSSTILLLDESLGSDDLTYARQQLLQFLDRLPESQPAGLYLRRGATFKILAEQTTNHGAVASALRNWVPSAQDLARAQEEETRNRQHFDTVDTPSGMQSVSENTDGMNALAAGPLSTGMNLDGNSTPDPKLSKEGQNPERDALAALIGVAANMNAIPGHKNLVWVASDNVLANWADKPGSNDRGANTIDAFELRIEEALNDAHVSLYPLDASQLEAFQKDASLQLSSVGLNPAVTTEGPTPAEGSSEKGEREQAEMQEDTHMVRPDIQNLARATGGRSFGRSGNLMGELNSVIADGDGTYLLSFSPDTQPDGKYHQITVAAPAQSGIKLRYRTGYLYSKEPSTLKERLRQAVWQPQDESEIGLRAHWDHASQGAAISLSIAGSDIDLVQKGDLWTDKLDIFLVQRDDTGTRARTKVQSLALNLKPETYQKVLRDGIPFAEYVEHKQTIGTTRIIVVDENSGRLGSVTLPVLPDRASQ
jgi:VWFA-related protein